MYQTGKQDNKIKKLQAFSLIEIIVSLALFSIIITWVIAISISMTNAQKNIQAQLFLVQTGQTVLENMSRQIRYGYNYSGMPQGEYDDNGNMVVAKNNDISTKDGSSASSTQILKNQFSSPYILFESQEGNPNSWADQNAFCVSNSRLYKLEKLDPESDGKNFSAKCESGFKMLPDDITAEMITFDIYGGDSAAPKNPMVRMVLRLKNSLGNTLEIQTTVTQRLITYF